MATALLPPEKQQSCLAQHHPLLYYPQVNIFQARKSIRRHGRKTADIVKGPFLGILILLLSAALVLPPKVNAFLGSITIQDEIEMGRKFDKMVREKLPIVTDPEVVDYATRITDRVVKAMPPMPYPVTVTVIKNPTLNAFAVPGGYVYIFTGLIENLNTEAQLAAIISHELAHVYHHHVAERMEKMKTVNLASMLGVLAGTLLGALAGGANMGNLGGAIAMGSMAGAQSAFLSYTRENEREADHSGMDYMVAAGYNPLAMVESFDLMRKKRWYMGGGDVPSYLQTHPDIEERMYYIKDRARRLDQDILLRVSHDRDFYLIKNLVRAKYTSPDIALKHYMAIPQKDILCPDYLGMAISFDRINSAKKAGEYFQKALNCTDMKSPLVLREAGKFYFRRGTMVQATKYLQRAMALNISDPVTKYYYARLLAEKGEVEPAIRYMREAMKDLPTDPSVRYHLGTLLGQKGDFFDGYLQLAYYNYYRGKMKKAGQRLEKAHEYMETKDQEKEFEKAEEVIKGD